MLLSVIKRGEKCGYFLQSLLEKSEKQASIEISPARPVCFLWHIKGREKKGAERQLQDKAFLPSDTLGGSRSGPSVSPLNGSRVQGVCAKKKKKKVSAGVE